MKTEIKIENDKAGYWIVTINNNSSKEWYGLKTIWDLFSLPDFKSFVAEKTETQTAAHAVKKAIAAKGFDMSKIEVI